MQCHTYSVKQWQCQTMTVSHTNKISSQSRYAVMFLIYHGRILHSLYSSHQLTGLVKLPWVTVCMVGSGSIATVRVPTQKTSWMANVYSVSVWHDTFVPVQLTKIMMVYLAFHLTLIHTYHIQYKYVQWTLRPHLTYFWPNL